MTDPLVWRAALVGAGLLLGIGLGWWLSRRRWLGGVRQLESFLEGWDEGWEEGVREGEDRAAELPRACPVPLKPVFEKLYKHRHAYLGLRSVSDAMTRRLEKLIDVLSEAVLLYDSRGQLLFTNEKMRQLVSTEPPSETSGAVADGDELRRIAEFLEANSDVPQLAAACLREGIQAEGREVKVTVGGEPKAFFATPHLIHSRSSSFAEGLLLLLTDMEVIAEVRRNAERRVALEHVQLATELMAHRVRNPLNSIVLVLELMRREHVGNGRLAKNLQTIQAEVGRLEATLERFLEATRIGDPRPESIELATVVETVSELLYPVARERGVRLRQELQVSSARVWADTSQILRAVLGPCLEAVRGAVPGAEVKLRLDSSRREHLLFIESRNLAPGSVGLAAAEELTGRNGGVLVYDDPDRPARLTYRFRAEAGPP